MQTIKATEQELEKTAKALLSAYPDERVFGFYGEMGAGKTTFIKAVCRVLGVKDVTSSPTFSIVNEYLTGDGEPVYHFDFYRIDSPDEAIRTGFEEYLSGPHYCLIEWTEKVEPILQGGFIPVTIRRIDEQTRSFSF